MKSILWAVLALSLSLSLSLSGCIEDQETTFTPHSEIVSTSASTSSGGGGIAVTNGSGPGGDCGCEIKNIVTSPTNVFFQLAAFDGNPSSYPSTLAKECNSSTNVFLETVYNGVTYPINANSLSGIEYGFSARIPTSSPTSMNLSFSVVCDSGSGSKYGGIQSYSITAFGALDPVTNSWHSSSTVEEYTCPSIAVCF